MATTPISSKSMCSIKYIAETNYEKKSITTIITTAPPDESHKSHKYHCVQMLLQNLMCQADFGIITHNWVHYDNLGEPKDRPMPDFKIEKMCRDSDGLLDWTLENELHKLGNLWQYLRIPEGMVAFSKDEHT